MSLTHEERPPAKVVPCVACGRPFTSEAHRLVRLWQYAGACPACSAPTGALPAKPAKNPTKSVPERYQGFDLSKTPAAFRNLAEQWDRAKTNPSVRHVALVGPPGRGKSRALWALAEQVAFEENSRPKAFEWESFALKSDRARLEDLTTAPWALLDNVGLVLLFPSVAANVRAALRLRLNHGRRTFLSIDDPGVDPGLLETLKPIALVVSLKP